MARRAQVLDERIAGADAARDNRGQLMDEQALLAEQARADRAVGLGERAALTADTRQARADSLSEQEVMRQRPIGELAQLLALAGGAPAPSYQGFSSENVNPADALGAYRLTQDALNTAYQGKLANCQQHHHMIGDIVGNLPFFFI